MYSRMLFLETKMKKILSVIEYFNKKEIIIWSSSVIGIIVSYYIFDGSNMIRLTAPLIGVTSILLNAKGNPVGQLLMIIFSILYGYISFSFAYYGEMIICACFLVTTSIYG